MGSFRFIFSLCIALGPISELWAQAPVISIEQAVQQALAANYAISIAQTQSDLVKNEVRLGNAGFLPRLDATGSRIIGTNNVRQETYNAATDSTRVIQRNGAGTSTLSGGVNLNWTIFNGMAMFIAYERLQELRDIGLDNTNIAIENTVASVSNAYYNIVQQKERLKVLRDALQVSRQRTQLAQSRYAVGTASKLEYLNARVDFNADSSALIRQQYQLQRAKVDLNQLLGQEPSAEFDVYDSIPLLPDINIEYLQTQMQDNNPSLLQAQRRQNVAYLEMKQLQAQRYPQLDVVSGYNYNQTQNEAGLIRYNRNVGFTYGLSARFNIFNGFNQSRQIQSARLNMQASRLRIDELRLQLEADLQNAYLDYQNRRQLIGLEQENLQVARQNEAIALDRYKLGVATPLEFREAQRNAVAAGSRLIEAIYQAKLAETELLRLSSDILK